MKLRSISSVKNLKGLRVLVRADFNVPLAQGQPGEGEDWRLMKTLPTIELLVKRGARVVLASHLGRPKKKAASFKLDPVARRLSKLLGRKVAKLPDCVGPKVVKAVAKTKNGDVVLLENLRFHAGEEKNDAKFAKRLAEPADIYVNDAFAACHRKAASLVAVTKHLPSYAGLLLQAEVGALERLLEKPARPYIVVMGGAKVSTKLGVIERLLGIADLVLVGGALANPFFKILGYGIGSSLTSKEDEGAARKLLKSEHIRKLWLPADMVVGNPKRPSARAEHVLRTIVPSGICSGKDAILDVGPRTVSAWSSFLRSAQTIVWNGPLGLFEVPKFSHGTLSLGRLIAARSKGKAFGVVGGGESVAALARTGLMDCVDHVSTGGGAMLEFLEGRKLPGLEALKQ